MQERLTIKEASLWASSYLKKNITTSNIAYLVQYAKIPKHVENGTATVSKDDLFNYYKAFNAQREIDWRKKLGEDLNWKLSFDCLKEKETTKHVHRLHPYKGKFIPQLVEYFIDDHTDQFKKRSYFQQGDIILDPFSGSGTTLVQASEQGIHAIGIDIAAFNTLIANVKISKVDFGDLENEINKITTALEDFTANKKNIAFEDELLTELNAFNKKFFPSPEYKMKIRQKSIIEQEYAPSKEKEFIPIFNRLRKKYKLKIAQEASETFLDKWYLAPVKNEIDFVSAQLKAVKNPITKKVITIILSRTIRSCRATTHADLATLKEPIATAYYCEKHGKICKPLFSILSWWRRYSKDTLNRLGEFNTLRTDTHQICLQADAKKINIIEAASAQNPALGALAKKKKIKGIFSSPPYLGLIDYHEQHAYAYDLFGFERNDTLEIGSLPKGQSKEAKNLYIEEIAQVLINAKRYMQKDYDVFLVANDKHNMYPSIAEKSGMRIVAQHKRPVLNRTEKDKSAYAEIIFHLKEE